MQTTKKDENVRNYRLRADRAQHAIDQIGDEHLDTGRASDDWEKVVTAARSRLERLKGELLAGVRDRSRPGVIQAACQNCIYSVLREIAAPEFVNRTLKPRAKGRR